MFNSQSIIDRESYICVIPAILDASGLVQMHSFTKVHLHFSSEFEMYCCCLSMIKNWKFNNKNIDPK